VLTDGAYLPSISLQSNFEPQDGRKKSTIMTDGDFYPELLSSQGGFTYRKILSATGANFRKYIVGSAAERNDVFFMRTSQNTIILRYSDILLMHAEAILAGANSTTDASALNAFNQVRTRAGLPNKLCLQETIYLRKDVWNLHLKANISSILNVEALQKQPQ
jgi:hypothetical protein